MNSRLIGVFLMFSALTSPSFAVAAEILADSKITAVTVFPRGAQVTRQTDITVDSGEHTVLVKDLPVSAIHDSIRVEGIADGKLEIGSVDVKTIYVPVPEDQSINPSERKKLEEEIQKLNDQKSSLNGILQTVQVQQDYIRELSRIPARPLGLSRNSENTGEPNWNSLFELIGSKMAELNQKQLDVGIKIRDLEEKIIELEEKLNSKPPHQDRRTQLRILVNSEGKLRAKLNVKYQVSNASWQPFYDARLNTSKGPEKSELSLTRRASVTQNSGEPWTDIALQLSTTKPNNRTSAPRLSALLVDFQPEVKTVYNNPPKLSGKMRMMDRAQPEADDKSYAAEKPASGLLSMNESPAPIDVAQAQARTQRSAFQALFLIPGKASIDTTGEAKKLTIDRLELQPQLKAVAVPKIQDAAYLSAKFTTPKDVQILRGRVSLHRDGVYIGNGFFPDLASGSDNELGFGTDDSIQIKYAEVNRSKGEAGIISSSKTDERKFRITVKNLHEWTIPLTIIDQVPFSENEKIEVKMLPDTTEPSRKNIEDKRGLLAWDFDLKNGEERQINLNYKIGWPNGENIIYKSK